MDLTAGLIAAQCVFFGLTWAACKVPAIYRRDNDETSAIRHLVSTRSYLEKENARLNDEVHRLNKHNVELTQELGRLRYRN